MSFGMFNVVPFEGKEMKKYSFEGYEDIPELTRDALLRYIEHGIKPGGFLLAVLSNNLFQAVARADVDNRAALPKLVTWIHNYAPTSVWGDPELVQDWLEFKREDWSDGWVE